MFVFKISYIQLEPEQNITHNTSNELEELLYIVCKQGSMDELNSLLREGDVNWNIALKGACEGGHLDIIKFVLSNSSSNVDWKIALKIACKKGSNEIVDLIVSNTPTIDWKMGLQGACEGGHIDLARKIRDKVKDIVPEDLMYAFSEACYLGNVDILRFMVSMGVYSWDDGFTSACLGGYIKIVRTMIMKGVTEWSFGFINACSGGHIKIVKLLYTTGFENIKEGLIEGFNEACLGGHLNIVKFLLRRDQKGFDWKWAMINACSGGEIGIVQLMICKLGKQLAHVWDEGLFQACSKGHISIVKLMIEKGAQNLNEGLRQACKNCQREVIDYLLDNGATDIDGGLKSLCLSLKRKDIILLLVTKGGNINNIDYLLYSEIVYLNREGVSNFGKHTKKAKNILNNHI